MKHLRHFQRSSLVQSNSCSPLCTKTFVRLLNNFCSQPIHVGVLISVTHTKTSLTESAKFVVLFKQISFSQRKCKSTTFEWQQRRVKLNTNYNESSLTKLISNYQKKKWVSSINSPKGSNSACHLYLNFVNLARHIQSSEPMFHKSLKEKLNCM